jgi:peptidyl-prolyl cis-trans isomerase SurA
MNRWVHFGFLLLILGTLATRCQAGEIVDRVVAIVNGHVILQSDWEEEIALEAFLDARAPDSFTAAERRTALDRLVDQELLREQVRVSEPAPADQVAARIAEVRKLHPEASTDKGWRAALDRSGLTQAALEQRLGDEIRLMDGIQARLRPSIQIDQHAIENYYRDDLLPELKKKGEHEVALAEVFGRIKDLLAEQRLNQLLNGWLASLRSESRIQVVDVQRGERDR